MQQHLGSKSEAAAAQDSPATGIQFQFELSKQVGEPVEVAHGVWWIRLPIDSSLDFVNVYALRDGNRLTLVDVGVNSASSIAALDAALASPTLAQLPLKRVIVTHFHPDHIGAAGILAQRGIELWMSRTCWLSCKLLLQTAASAPKTPEVEFMRRAGLSGIELEAYKRQPPHRYQKQVAALPDDFVPLSDGQHLTIGDRSWKILVGNGHAAEHLTLWSDGLAIVGDQILPSISSNLTIPFTEPEGDLVAEWLLSCQKLLTVADNQILGLPGHQRPFTGLQNRLVQIQSNMEGAMERLSKILVRPSSALECMEQFHNRSLTFDQRKQMLPEIVGFLNHLYRKGDVERKQSPQGSFVYTRKRNTLVELSTSHPTKEDKMNSPILPSNTPPTAVQSAPEAVESTAQALPEAVTPVAVTSTQQFSSESVASKANTSWLQPKRWIAALSLVGILGACYAYRDQLQVWGNEAFDKLSQIQLLEKPQSVRQELSTTVMPVQVMTLKNLSSTELPRRFTGVIKPRRASEIGFNRVGTMDEILVERGQRVEKDAVLAKLNVASLQANMKAVQAQYKAATARLEEMIAGPRSQTIDSARNQFDAARAELDLAKTSLGRAERLVSIGAVSKQEVDNAQTMVKAKQEAVNAAENTLNELKEGTRTEQIRAQRAVLNELEAAQDQMKVQLDESVIRAPFAAAVSERFLDPGTVCSPGVPVVRLIELVSPEVWIGLPPEYSAAMNQSNSYSIKVNGQSFDAKLKSVLPELDSGTRTNTVVFELETSDSNSIFGQVAEIELSRPIRESGFWLPMSAIVKGDHGLWGVLVLEKDPESGNSRLVKQELEVVHVDSDRVYARGTIADGERVVATGLQRLTPGQLVRALGTDDGQQVGVNDDATLR